MGDLLVVSGQLDGELRVSPEFRVAIVKEDEPTNKMGPREPQVSKREKNRGRNKNRPPPMKFSLSQRLCPVLVDVSPEREVLPVCSHPNCSFQHDLIQFLDNKPPDLGPDCFVYLNYGRCKRGVTCCFSQSHILVDRDKKSVRNIVNRDLALKLGPLNTREMNHLDKDTQIQLRKKAYNFQAADKKMDEIFKLRESEKLSVEAQPSDAKKAKVDDSNGAMDVTIETDVPKIADSTLLDFDDSGQSRLFKKINWSDKLYLAPLTTVGNLPFRRICKEFGADITCGEMAMSVQMLQAHPPEWALVQRHVSEDIFGIQLCGNSPQQMTRIAQLVEDRKIDCDFVDLNLGCPIDLVYKQGMGSGLMDRKKPLEVMVRAMSAIMSRPVTIKIRTGINKDKRLAHNLIPCLKEWGIDMITLHGRSREQRYTKLADWSYIKECAEISKPTPIFGNGDIMNYEDYYAIKEKSKVDGIMIARGALIKPWVFKEIKDHQHWDISATERLDIIKRYANYGMEHWGSDSKGVETTRRFMLEWLSFLHRYVPVGILEQPPQRMNERVPAYNGRSDLETLLSSPACSDWIKVTEMFLGKVPEGFAFEPKHKAHGF